MKIECLLEEYELLIHQVLKEYQIYPNRHDYEDFAQELRLHLFEELKRLLTSKHQVENMEAYLRHAMRWRLFKLLRQQKRHQCRVTPNSWTREIGIVLCLSLFLFA